jgi:hypothetical protein
MTSRDPLESVLWNLGAQFRLVSPTAKFAHWRLNDVVEVGQEETGRKKPRTVMVRKYDRGFACGVGTLPGPREMLNGFIKTPSRLSLTQIVVQTYRDMWLETPISTTP